MKQSKPHLLSTSLSLLAIMLLLFSTSTIGANAEGSYNDPYYPQQWWIPNMNLESAWQQTYSNNEIIIAVIDTGVQYDHEDLADHMWINKGEIPDNGIDDDKNGYIDDYHGWDFFNNDASTYSSSQTARGIRSNPYDSDDHGTHVSGIIAATANNKVGIAGVAHNVNVKIMNLKVFGGNGVAQMSNSFIDAIKYAQANGARIVNASWYVTGNKKNEAAIARVIRESDMLFVAAAGNSQKDTDKYPIIPASLKYTNVLSVGACDPNNNLSNRFSNYGKKTVCVGAPGIDIISCYVGGYDFSDGTSMAAPMVTGTAALALAANPTLSAAELKNVINASVTKVPSLTSKTMTGGIVNALKTVQTAKATKHHVDTVKPNISCKLKKKKKKTTASIKVTDQGGSNIRLVRYAKGKKKASFFKKGQKGTYIPETKKLTFKKKTKITIYALDFEGNEKIKTVTISVKK